MSELEAAFAPIGADRVSLRLGANGYLTKPIEVAEVASVVRRLIARQ